jgi:NAD(P)-dependent dehydrogenase (short-subunit alcohol dehydrogenase family)
MKTSGRGEPVDFENRTALVTGATGALGSAVTRHLLANGARVAAVYRSQKEFENLAQREQKRADAILGVQADLTRGEEIAKAVAAVVERWGKLDYALAVAGGFAAGKSYETDEPTWDHMFDLNLRSVYLLVRAAVPVMIRQNFGRIVTVSSGAILRGGGAGVAAYAVSKDALRKLSEILADELKDYNIHVHCVMPGTMDTAANRRAMPKADFSKWVKTEDVARAIGALLGEGMSAARSVVVPVLG